MINALQRHLSQARVPGWPLALLRIYVGVYFLVHGWGKVIRGAEFPPALPGFFENYAGKMPGFYQAFVDGVVLPNVTLFGYLVAYGELFLGLALIAGVLTRLASFLGAVMVLNFLWVKGLSFWLNFDHDGVLIVLFLLFMFTAAGRVSGVDHYLHQRKPNKWLW